GRSHWRVDRRFEGEEGGPPRGREFGRVLGALSYVAESNEGGRLRAPAAAAWEQFWKRRDPTPETTRNESMLEFLRRVRYSEQHFQGFGPGWRSDMGRIYIKFGAPDHTEARPPSPQAP